MQTTQPRGLKKETKQGQSQSNFKKTMQRFGPIYLLMLPGIAFFGVFCYAPLYGLQLAFKNYKIGKGIWGSPWVGMSHFTKLMARAEFWRAFWNTLELSFLKLLICFPIPIIIALAFNEIRNKKLMKGLQIVYTLPNFLSWIIISGILKQLLMSSGTINQILRALGGQPIDFLTNGTIFRGVLIVSDIWKSAGWSSIIYMAAIASVDASLYDSATVDGANRWQKMWHITLAGIRPTIATLLILAVGGSMNGNFDQIYNMYNPTVISSSDIIDTYIYRITFEQAPNYGFSTAVGLFKGVINCILLLTANIAVSKLDDNSRII